MAKLCVIVGPIAVEPTTARPLLTRLKAKVGVILAGVIAVPH